MNDKLLFKRIFDLISSTLLMAAVSPIFFFIYIFARMMNGRPVFFTQDRLGKNGKVFKIIKFRTMIVDATKQGKGIFLEENDKRITFLGRVLRKTSLDELPQLISVIRGDMSVIGPRPPLTIYPYKYEDYPLKFKKRFFMKPGLTGYAQISGRKTLNWNERFPYDVYYTENYSFWLDIIILLKSIVCVFKTEGVHGDD